MNFIEFRRSRHKFETFITRNFEVLRGFTGRRWKSPTLELSKSDRGFAKQSQNIELWPISIGISCRLRPKINQISLKLIKHR